MTDNRSAGLGEVGGEGCREALSVGLLVVEDECLPRVERGVCEVRISSALHDVGRAHPEEGDLAARAKRERVDRGVRARDRQSGVGARRADLREVRRVRDRLLGLADARVEGPTTPTTAALPARAVMLAAPWFGSCLPRATEASSLSISVNVHEPPSRWLVLA